MRAILHHLDWQAIFLGLVAGYLVPLLLVCFLSTGVWRLWLLLVAPVVAGYLVARLAVKLPLMHGLAASMVSLLLLSLLFPAKTAMVWMTWAMINTACSIFGSVVWRWHARRIA